MIFGRAGHRSRLLVPGYETSNQVARLTPSSLAFQQGFKFPLAINVYRQSMLANEPSSDGYNLRGEMATCEARTIAPLCHRTRQENVSSCTETQPTECDGGRVQGPDVSAANRIPYPAKINHPIPSVYIIDFIYSAFL